MKLCLRCNQYFDEPIEICPNDGIALENVGKDPLIGALINNRYLVDSVIGKGSSGIVYKARRLGRGAMVVAIKVLHSYIGAAGSSLDRFLREAQAASRLRNPHIITIWESGVTEDGQPYFVMDYLEGSTLGHLIKEKGNLEPKRVLSLLHQICEALGEAHRLGIVHRDLKPENVVLQESDHGHDYVKLLDFGIADSPQHTQSSFKLEKPRTVSGSPAYMSPEQCQGLDLDGRSDIYSLAIMVFEMLTGKRPFPQQDNVNVMVLHVKEPPMTLADVRPDLEFPVQVEAVLARALSKQPFERQDNVQDFLLEFELAWQNDESPIDIIQQPVAPPIANTISYSNKAIEEKPDSEITSDHLSIQDGENTLAAWGNVSIQSSNKTAVAERGDSIFPPSTVPNTPDQELSLLDMWRADEASNLVAPNPASNPVPSPDPSSAIMSNHAVSPPPVSEINEFVEHNYSPELLIQPELSSINVPETVSKIMPETVSEITPENMPDPINEQFITSRNKTIERLIEAAKKGQTESNAAIRSKLYANKENPALVNAETNTTRTYVQSDLSTQSVPSPSGWYPIQENKLSSIAEPTAAPQASSLATSLAPSGIPSPLTSMPASIPNSATESHMVAGNDLTAAVSQPDFMPVAKAQVPNNYNPATAPISYTDLNSIGKQRLLSAKDLSTSASSLNANSEPGKAYDTGVYIKQKYRNTLSRLQGRQKPTRFDTSLVTTRVRSAALKADMVKPPVNLWHYAVAVVVSACLLACAYVCYSALTVPIPPVTSIELLFTAGNYQQIIDILEGKSLSVPLDNKEKEQLSASYLNLAKVELSQKKTDSALSLLTKVDPLSLSASEANQLKVNITGVKHAVIQKQ